MTAPRNVMYGPSDSGMYPAVVYVANGTTVTAIWKEGTWVFIETGGKRGYVPASTIQVTESVPTVTFSNAVRYVHTAGPTYLAPNTSYSAGSVSYAEKVWYSGQMTNNYAFIEYYTNTAGTTRKRAYFPAGSLGYAAPANEKGIRPVGSSFKTNDYPNYPSGNYHGGTDIGSTEGANPQDAVKASFAGTVVSLVNNVAPGTGTSYGNHVVIESTINGTKYRTWYAHLDSVPSGITNGKSITKGQTIGYVGNTGNCIPRSYYHLHLEYRKTPFSYQTNNVDPKMFY